MYFQQYLMKTTFPSLLPLRSRDKERARLILTCCFFHPIFRAGLYFHIDDRFFGPKRDLQHSALVRPFIPSLNLGLLSLTKLYVFFIPVLSQSSFVILSSYVPQFTLESDFLIRFSRY